MEWPALESDPKIFTDYFHKIGAPEDIKFVELLSLESYQDFLIIEGDILGLILNFSRKNKKPIDVSRLKSNDYVPFYMKQTPKLDNACGLIAGLHILGNADNIEYNPEGFLKKFYESNKGKKPEEIAKSLEKDDTCKEAHHEAANEGQTNLENTDVVYHYIGFIYKKGEIIELDGLKNGPYVIKDNVNKDDFIKVTSNEILRRVREHEINEGINVMLLYDKRCFLTNLLEE